MPQSHTSVSMRWCQVSFGTLPDKPLVSILVPSYNQGQFIGDTIDSILEQDYRPIKVYVVDGASTDNTIEVLKSYGDIPELEWISEPDRGVVDAVNKGFKLLDGDINGIQSSDDMYRVGTIRRIVEEFRQHPNHGLIYGDTVMVDAEGRETSRREIGPWSLRNMLLMRTWIPQPSAFFRREMLVACGDWDESIPYAPDTDLWLRMSGRTSVLKINEFLSARRIHEAQRDAQIKRIANDYCQMIDHSEVIRDADAQTQRCARAGKYLIKTRYNPHKDRWFADFYAGWCFLRAGMIMRGEFRWHSIYLHFLYFPTRRVLSRIKRVVVGKKAQVA